MQGFAGVGQCHFWLSCHFINVMIYYFEYFSIFLLGFLLLSISCHEDWWALLNSLQSPWALLTVACFHTMSNCPSFKLIFSLRDCSQFLTFPKFSSTLLMSLNSDISQISDPIVSLIIFYQPTS